MPTVNARRRSRPSRRPARSPPHRAPLMRPARPSWAPVGHHPDVARTQAGADCPWSWRRPRHRSRACRPHAAPRPARAGWSGRARCGPRRDDRQDAPRASARRFHASPDRMTAGTGHRLPGPRRGAAARHPMRRNPGRALPAAADRRRTTEPRSHPGRTAGRQVPVAGPVARLPPAVRSPTRSRGHRPAARHHCRPACSGRERSSSARSPRARPHEDPPAAQERFLPVSSSPARSPQARPHGHRPAAPHPPAAPERCLPACSSPGRSDEVQAAVGLPRAGLPACSLGNHPAGQVRFRPACSGPARSRQALPARRIQRRRGRRLRCLARGRRRRRFGSCSPRSRSGGTSRARSARDLRGLALATRPSLLPSAAGRGRLRPGLARRRWAGPRPALALPTRRRSGGPCRSSAASRPVLPRRPRAPRRLRRDGGGGRSLLCGARRAIGRTAGTGVGPAGSLRGLRSGTRGCLLTRPALGVGRRPRSRSGADRRPGAGRRLR